jgi:hypothetical protein
MTSFQLDGKLFVEKESEFDSFLRMEIFEFVGCQTFDFLVPDIIGQRH